MKKKQKPAVYAKRRWRVYFTCRAQWPNTAAIDQGTIETQIAVKSVRCDVPFTSHTDKGRPGLQLVDAGSKGPIKRRDRRLRPNEPFWWIEVDAELEILDGRAHFYQPPILSWKQLHKYKVGERIGLFTVTGKGRSSMNLTLNPKVKK